MTERTCAGVDCCWRWHLGHSWGDNQRRGRCQLSGWQGEAPLDFSKVLPNHLGLEAGQDQAGRDKVRRLHPVPNNQHEGKGPVVRMAVFRCRYLMLDRCAM